VKFSEFKDLGDTILINMVLPSDIKAIEVLGWLYNDQETQPYYGILKIDNNISSFDEKRIFSFAEKKDIEEVIGTTL